MRKLLLGCLLALLCAAGASAQSYTTVSGTVSDNNSTPYVAGKLTISFVNTTGQQATFGGNANFQQVYAGIVLDSTGSFSVSLPSNAVIIPNNPTTQWNFNVVASDGGSGFSTNITISGSTQNVGATLTAAAPRITFLLSGTNQPLCAVGQTIVAVAPKWGCGAGGGGAVSSVFTRTGAVVAATNDYTVAQVNGAAPLASPTFTGVPAGPTAALSTNTTQLATTAFVLANAGGTPNFPVTVINGVSGGIPCFTSTTNEAASVLLTVNVMVKGGGAGACPTNSLLTDNGTTATYTGTGGVSAVGYTGTGAGAGFFAYGAGADNCVALQPANSDCEEANTTITTAFHRVRNGTPVTGFQFWTYAAPVWTESEGPISGDCTTAVLVITCTKLNGTAFAGTNGDVVSFGAANVPADTGFLATNVVRKDTTNAAAAAMTLDLSASTVANAFKVPVAAGGTAGANGVMVYDSTAGVQHQRANAADALSVSEATNIAAGFLPKATDATHALLTASLCDEGITTANVFTCTQSAGGQFTKQVAVGAAPTITHGTAGDWWAAEGTGPSAIGATGAYIYADSTTHELEAATNASTTPGIILRVHPGQIKSTGLVAAVTTATLCAASAGACNVAGMYHVHIALYQTGTACSANTTAGVSPSLTWTDGNGTAHSAIGIPLFSDGIVNAITGTMAWGATTVAGIASGDFNIDTNGTVIQYAIAFAQCTTGTATYAADLTVTRLE